jgi:hypothetical protein
MENSLTLAILFEKKEFRCRESELTDEFINSLKVNDIFSFHCRDFVKYLGFKRCDKKFRESFYKWLVQNNIGFVITNRKLTANIIYNFFNSEEIVRGELDKSSVAFNPNGQTWRQLYNWLIETKATDKTFEELIQQQISIHKSLYSIEIKEDRQQLSGSFNGGCWLILWKKF